jgi:hypothetical protein
MVISEEMFNEFLIRCGFPLAHKEEPFYYEERGGGAIVRVDGDSIVVNYPNLVTGDEATIRFNVDGKRSPHSQRSECE